MGQVGETTGHPKGPGIRTRTCIALPEKVLTERQATEFVAAAKRGIERGKRGITAAGPTDSGIETAVEEQVGIAVHYLDTLQRRDIGKARPGTVRLKPGCPTADGIGQETGPLVVVPQVGIEIAGQATADGGFGQHAVGFGRDIAVHQSGNGFLKRRVGHGRAKGEGFGLKVVESGHQTGSVHQRKVGTGQTFLQQTDQRTGHAGMGVTVGVHTTGCTNRLKTADGRIEPGMCLQTEHAVGR